MTTQQNNLTAIGSIITAIANAKITLKTARQSVADILPAIVQALQSKDFEKAGKMLFQKVGGTTFYNLYLRDFFKSQHFMLEYDVKKDTLIWLGSFKELKVDNYLDFFEAEKEARQKAKAAMSKADKVRQDFESRISKLDKTSLEALAKLVNDYRHKTI